METTLPSGKNVSIQRLNVDFQRSLLAHFDEDNDPTTLGLKYIQFVNNYLLSIYPEIKYLDKLFVLNKWVQEFSEAKEDTIPEFKNINFDNTNTVLINDIDVTIKLQQPSVVTENLLLEYLLTKEERDNIDLSFFDNFRFVESITFNSVEHKTTDITVEELYQIYLLFDLPALQKLSDSINSTLDKITDLRTLEADFSFFIDL
tara:strand:- start:602 stop:1210 length:609 start_codon:yes stop_codon:yes gene_type:complete